jgi:hypothetical protein
MATTLSVPEAKRLTQRIRQRINAIHADMDELQIMIAAAREGLAWQILGFPSWTAYLADLINIEVAAEQRREVIALLIPERISQPAMAKMLNVSRSQIQQDMKRVRIQKDYSPDLDSPKFVTGLDNRTYPVPDAPSDPVPEPELVKLIKRATRNMNSLSETLVDVYCTPEFSTTREPEIDAAKNAMALAAATLEKHLWPTNEEIVAIRRKKPGRSTVTGDVVKVDFGT